METYFSVFLVGIAADLLEFLAVETCTAFFLPRPAQIALESVQSKLYIRVRSILGYEFN